MVEKKLFNPTKIIAVGLNYKDHAQELSMELPDEPLIFLKPPTSVIGHDEKIAIPNGSKQVDYEAELAIVIKKQCKDAEVSKAKEYIEGYTCANDVTARDFQKKDVQWSRAKSFDTFCPLGPCIINDIDPTNLDIKLLLNGEIKQSSNTNQMLFNAYDLVSFVSKIMTLLPGDIILTGTPPGVGSLRKGDSVEVRIEGIGSLVNYVE
ncbi:MAG: FAA hydrolase family protein [Actinobacteria bacterium]|nr:MAG: FAA hydrolase family protein [Actinomycetota bacterium]